MQSFKLSGHAIFRSLNRSILTWPRAIRPAYSLETMEDF